MDADHPLAGGEPMGDVGGSGGLGQVVHGLDQDEVRAGLDEVLDHLGVLGPAGGVVRREIGPVAIFEGRNRAQDQGVGPEFVPGPPRDGDRQPCQLGGAVAEARLGQRPAVSAKRIGRDGAGPRLQVIAVDLGEHLRGLQQGPGRPQGQPDVHAATIQLGAGGPVEQEDLRALIHGPWLSRPGAGS
jgi:hypothetical protein